VSEPRIDRCTRCGQDVIWCKSLPSEKLMPLDAAPNNTGSVVLFPFNTCKVLNKADANVRRGMDLPMWLSHFASCPALKRKEKVKR